MEAMIRLLHDGDYSCVVANGDEVRTFERRGIIDIYELHKSGVGFLNGASVADKVIGKGAAGLMALSGVSRVYADVISSGALDLLRDAGIEVEFDCLVPFIENRDKTDWCPLETLCKDVDSPADILPVVEAFIVMINKKMRGEKV